jgi:hypothetical protein
VCAQSAFINYYTSSQTAAWGEHRFLPQPFRLPWNLVFPFIYLLISMHTCRLEQEDDAQKQTQLETWICLPPSNSCLLLGLTHAMGFPILQSRRYFRKEATLISKTASFARTGEALCVVHHISLCGRNLSHPLLTHQGYLGRSCGQHLRHRQCSFWGLAARLVPRLGAPRLT